MAKGEPDFDWLERDPAKTACVTCASSEAIQESIRRWVEGRRAGKPMVSIGNLRDLLCEKFGYTWASATLRNHIDRCLGFTSTKQRP